MKKSNHGRYDDIILKVLIILLIISSAILLVCIKIYVDREGLIDKILAGRGPSYYTVEITNDSYDEQISSIVNSLIKDDMSDFDKFKILHDFVVSYVDYDYSALDNIESINTANDPAHVLETGWGVCGGYASLYEALCNEAGLNCEYVSGYADFLEKNTGHAWNAVTLEGNVYHVDCCWDDVAAEDDKYDWFLQGNNYVTNDCRKWTQQYNFSAESYPVIRSKLVPYDILIKYEDTQIEEES